MKINDFYTYMGTKLNIYISNYSNKENKYISYIKDILYGVLKTNKPAVYLRKQREKVRTDLDDLERAFVGADSFDGVGAGYNNGLKKNTVEQRQLEKIQMRENLLWLLERSLEFEREQKTMNDYIVDLIDQLPQETYKETLKLTFISCMDAGHIAAELYFDTTTIISHRKRGIKALAKLIENLEKTQNSGNLL